MKRLPNLLTLLRMLGAAALIGLDVQRPAFWIIYALCGLSDMLDGHLARRLHAESALGGRLDSAADGLFAVVCAVRLLPLIVRSVRSAIPACLLASAAAVQDVRFMRKP